MHEGTDPIIFYIFAIFAGSAVLATVALYARQALIVGYILMGILIGPHGLHLINNTDLISAIADIGIIFLLFLLGLHLQPQDLLNLLRKTTVLTLVSSLIFGILGFLVGIIFQFTLIESIIIGVTVIFSSTIIGLKLLPTTVLHHKHAGEIIISILLFQDLLAILALLIVQGWGKGGSPLFEVAKLTLSLPFLVVFALAFEHYILIKLIRRFDKIQEYIFLMTIGWCLGMAEMAHALGLSYEIGAFLGGVVLASSPIALYIAESLKPLRDFFLVMFFFTLGAKFDLSVLSTVFIPAITLAAIVLFIKPFVFKYLLVKLGEPSNLSLEMGVRLGQISEFSLLIAVVALESSVISDNASFLIQTATILTFIFSSYYIVMTYPTPVALSDKLRRD